MSHMLIGFLYLSIISMNGYFIKNITIIDLSVIQMIVYLQHHMKKY